MAKGDMLNPLNGIKAVGRSIIHPNQAAQGVGRAMGHMFHHNNGQQQVPANPGVAAPQPPMPAGQQPWMQNVAQAATSLSPSNGMMNRKFGGGAPFGGSGGASGMGQNNGGYSNTSGANPYRNQSTGFGRQGNM